MPAERQEQQEKEVDRGWAWVVVAAGFYVHFIGAGTIMCFGVLYVELLDYFPEPRSVSSLIPSITGISFSFAGQYFIIMNVNLELLTLFYSIIFCSYLPNLLHTM